MILCLADAHASIFNTPHKAFSWLNQHMNVFFCHSEVYQFLPANFFGNFYLTLLHLSIQISTLVIRSSKPLRYTCECNNSYKLWKSTKLGINIIFLCSWKRLVSSSNIIAFNILEEDERSSTYPRKAVIQEWSPAALHIQHFVHHICCH